MEKMNESKIGFQDTKKAEQAATYRSLVSLVNSCENRIITVDLRNEAVVIGRVLNSDHVMNIEMGNAVFYDAVGNKHVFENFFLQARNIRYVHIPSEVDPEALIKSYWESLKHKPIKKGQSTFKKSRAQKYQKSILEDLNKASTSGQHS